MLGSVEKIFVLVLLIPHGINAMQFDESSTTPSQDVLSSTIFTTENDISSRSSLSSSTLENSVSEMADVSASENPGRISDKKEPEITMATETSTEKIAETFSSTEADAARLTTLVPTPSSFDGLEATTVHAGTTAELETVASKTPSSVPAKNAAVVGSADVEIDSTQTPTSEALTDVAQNEDELKIETPVDENASVGIVPEPEPEAEPESVVIVDSKVEPHEPIQEAVTFRTRIHRVRVEIKPPAQPPKNAKSSVETKQCRKCKQQAVEEEEDWNEMCDKVCKVVAKTKDGKDAMNIETWGEGV